MERKTKVLALVAHDNMKRDLAEWVDWNSRKLSRHHLVCTGTTGKMVEKTLRDHREEHEDETEEKPELKITLLMLCPHQSAGGAADSFPRGGSLSPFTAAPP